ncbi:MAG: helix-turn-helix domain-containing protein [Bacteroidales bacterium]|nr:helix-turn-helix domain-containing protein [Bacteroidales bacterium]
MENPFDLLNEKLIRIETVLNEIKEFQRNEVPAPFLISSEKLIGDKALAEYLGCTIQTVSRLKKTGKITFHRYGRKYYYKSQEIDESLKGKEQIFDSRKQR